MKFHLGDNVKIGENVKIGIGSLIGDNVVIGDNVKIDDYAKICDNCIIGEGSYIGSYTIIGEIGIGYKEEKPREITNIGSNSIIRSGTIIYSNNNLGSNLETGHRVTIREKSKISNNVRIGTLSDIQGDCEIGEYSRLHSNVHIGKASKIGNYVWIFPYVILTNDPTPPSENCLGVVVKDFAVIATASTILPGIEIGEDSLVGASTLVSKNVEEKTVVVGNPQKCIGSIERLNKGENIVYPWKYTFKRGMPWENLDFDKWLLLLDKK